MFCKHNILFAFVCASWIVFSAPGCSESSSQQHLEERYSLIAGLVGDENSTLFSVHANDSMPGDSVLRNWKRGVLLSTQPGGEYTLTAHADESLELNLFEFNGTSVRQSPVIFSGTCDGTECLIPFAGASGRVKWWIAALSDRSGNGVGPESFSLDGYRKGNDTLPIHIVFLGNLSTLPDSAEQHAFAERMISRMGALYAPSQILPVLAGWGADERGKSKGTVEFDPENWEVSGVDTVSGILWQIDLDEMAVAPLSGEAKGLTIAVVEKISTEGYIGVAPLFGLHLGTGTASVAVIGLRTDEGNGSTTLNSEEVLFETIAHEVGHFFGLRHTTATLEDRSTMNDQSVIEDGLSDTPFGVLCGIALGGRASYKSGTTKRFPEIHYEARIRSAAAAADIKCPDVENLMFPLAVDGTSQTVLSPSQGRLMRANLHLLQW